MKQPFNNKAERSRRSTGIPKGVYRFKTLEEADEWEKKMLGRNAVSKPDSPPAKPGDQPPKV